EPTLIVPDTLVVPPARTCSLRPWSVPVIASCNALPVMLSWPAFSMTPLVVILMRPLDHVVAPFRRSVAPPLRSTGPAIVEAAWVPPVSVLPVSVRLPLRFRLPMAASAAVSDGAPPAPMTTSSLEDGTPDGLQFAGVSHAPEPTAHVLVAAEACPAEPSHH